MDEVKLPGDLIDCAWLQAHRHCPDLILLDASTPPPGKTAPIHCRTIGGARRFDIEAAFSDRDTSLPHMMPSAAQFQREARKLGIRQSSAVLLFDDQGIFSAPRAWWMFKAMGFDQVAVLDGGLPAWQQSGGDITDTYAVAEREGDFVASPRESYFCNAEKVHAALAKKDACVIDARSADRFFGRVDEPRPGLRRGHMPGAYNLPFDTLLQNQAYRALAELSSELEKINPNRRAQLIFSCGSGVTAAILGFAAHLSGYQHLSVYDGSWAEWGARDDLPVER